METTLKKNKEGYGYKYTDLSQIHEYLEANNMKYYQEINTCEANGKDYVYTYRYIDGKWEDKPIRGCQVADAVLSGVKNPAQEQGSALTYARRYSLLLAFGLCTEDDDAESLSIRKEATLKDAQEYVFTFGKKKGQKLTEVVKDSGYISWLLNNSNDEFLLKCVELLTGEIKQPDEVIDKLSEMQNKLMSYEMKGENLDIIKEAYKVKSISDMSETQLTQALNRMKEKYGE